MNTIDKLARACLKSTSIRLVTAALLMTCNQAQADHGPLPVPPEGSVIAASFSIYDLNGDLVESVDALDVGVGIRDFLGPSETYSYTSILGPSAFYDFQVYFPSSNPAQFDFFDGNTFNGVTVPFSLEVGSGQRAFQYLWDINGQTQVVIGLFDLIQSNGLWTISTVDTDPGDNLPGTAFLSGPLEGYSVAWDMTISAPLPAGFWLFVSAFVPMLIGLRKR